MELASQALELAAELASRVPDAIRWTLDLVLVRWEEAGGFLGLGVGVGLLFWWGGLSDWRERRRLLATPRSRARSLALGGVDMSGRALRDRPLEAPFTGEACVYYEWEVEAEVPDPRDDRDWELLAHGSSERHPFHIREETGRVRIEPAGADIDLEITWMEEDPPLSPRMRDFLRKEAIEVHSGASKRRLRFTESIIRPGEPLTIRGVAQDRRELDTDGNGYLSASEWEGVHDRVVVGRDTLDSGHAFTITNKSADQVLEELTEGVILGWMLGPLFFFGSLAGLLYRHGLLGR